MKLILPRGYAYSLAPNPWAWLTSREAAEAMAEEVATWRDLYNIDGIDLDIESGAGDRQVKGHSMRNLVPQSIIIPYHGLLMILHQNTKIPL